MLEMKKKRVEISVLLESKHIREKGGAPVFQTPEDRSGI